MRPDEPGGAEDLLVDGDRRGALLAPSARRACRRTRARRARRAAAIAPTFTTSYSILNAVLEAAQLRDPHVERRLAALEPGRDRAAGPGLLALRAAARGLALAGGDAAADAGLARVRARAPGAGRAASCLLLGARDPSAISSTVDEEADLADHAAGRVVVGDLDGVADAAAGRGPGASPGCGRCG